MIHYSLRCEHGDEFEAWFRNSDDYETQNAAHQVACPYCGSTLIEKAPMAPNIARTDRERPLDRRAVAMAMAAKVKEHIRDNFDYVGERFPEEARKIAAGDMEDRPIWGEATVAEAKAMAEEGLPVAPLPAEIAPTPPKKLN
ncbi:MAG: DUF1178 family protein [Hyphomonadaceae bacterium]